MCCGSRHGWTEIAEAADVTYLPRIGGEAYFSFTRPTTSPPPESTACTQTLLKPSFNSGYLAIIALARPRASAWVALKSAVLGTEYFIERSKFFSLRKIVISVML